MTSSQQSSATFPIGLPIGFETDEPVIELLFFGDIVGRPGRDAVKFYLQQLKDLDKWPDVVIANVENATHGFGLSKKHYDEFSEAGIDIMTGGNHIWDRKDIFDFIHDADKLLRPDNFPAVSPGLGGKVFEIDTRQGRCKIGVMNLIGQVFMGLYNSPWESLDRQYKALQEETNILFLDFHAEATAEKICMARHSSTLGFSAMVGTHTHVQTADNKILNNQMGYVTDAGFNGAYDSVIGMDPEGSIKRLKDQLPARLDVADSKLVQLNGIRFWINPETGRCLHTERLNETFSLAKATQPAPTTV